MAFHDATTLGVAHSMKANTTYVNNSI